MTSGRKYKRFKYVQDSVWKLDIDDSFHLHELLDEFPSIRLNIFPHHYNVDAFTVFVIDSLRKLHIRRSTIVSVLMQLEEFTP